MTAANSKTFSYDSPNELVSMNGTAVEIVYDGDGNRVSKTVTIPGSGTTTTYYLVDDLNPTRYPQVMDELNGSGVVTRTYIYGLQRIGEDQVINSTWTPSFYSYDGMGSVRQLTNAAGAVTDTYEYDAYGNALVTTGSTPNVYLYRGEQWDPDLGMYYLRARYYNPMIDRFMSRDPLDGDTSDPLSLHKYLYAEGDPVDRLDPSGGTTATMAPPAARSTGTTVEYALIIGEISLGATAALPKIAEDVNCILFRAAAVVGLASDPSIAQISQHGCTATGTGRGSAPGLLPGTGPGNPPQPCTDFIGQCDKWAKKHRRPGEKYIIYKTTISNPECGRFANYIISSQLDQRIGNNGFHVGLLKGGTVRDSIYPGGISLDFWEGSA